MLVAFGYWSSITITYGYEFVGFKESDIIFCYVCFLSDNLERCILYLSLSVCIGIILVLALVAIRLNCVSNRYRRHAKLDITEPLPHSTGGGMGQSSVIHQVSPDEDLTSLGSSSNNDLNGIDMYGMSHGRRPPPFPTNDSLNRTLNPYYGWLSYVLDL